MQRILTGLIILSFFFIAQVSEAAISVPQNFNLNDGAIVDYKTTTSIEQYGITWTFAEPVQFGQFSNGDYWVIDPGAGVKITNINPGDTLHPVSGRHMHGSMLNPSGSLQGFDSINYYQSNLNVGIGISAENPFILTSNNSLVSSISNIEPTGTTSYTKTAAILTCLSSAPPSGSFRPGYSDPQKKIYGNVNQLDYTKLGKLAPTPSTPDPVAYAEKFQKTWLMHSPSWTSRYMHPSDNIPDNYYYTEPLSIAALLLQVNFTDQQKEKLLINFIQHGIDLYGAVKSTGYGWTAAAGVGYGRKWPILFAGIMLNAQDMKNIGAVSGDYLNEVEGYGPGNNPPGYIRFAEDSLVFYVTQADVDQSAKPLSCADIETCTINTEWCPDCRAGTPMPYTTAMIGMPEWGHRYSDNKAEIDSAWYANYRTIGSGTRYIVGSTLAARIMKAKELWHCNAHFDYSDRYMAISKGLPDPFGYKVTGESAVGSPLGFVGEMWSTYRKLY